jgi:thioredoxin 1
MNRLTLASAALLCSALLACARADPPAAGPARASSAAPSALAGRPAPVGSKPTLVFFMNPNGRPCQLQDEVLRSMPDLPERANLVRFKTTEPGDIARFEQFGIRSLPQLVLLDAGGAVIRRPTPGILSDPQVRELLAP